MPEAKIESTSIISRHQSYYGWATVGKCRNADLLVAASGSREAHVCPYGRVHLLRSTDGGETWAEPDILTHGPLDDRDAGILETADGTLLVNYFNSLAWMHYLYRHETGQVDWYTPETRRRWSKLRDWLSDNVKVAEVMGDWILRSTDNGATWSEPIPTTVNSPHGPVQMANGRLIYAGKATCPPRMRIRGSAHEEGEIAVAFSDDDGQSWTRGAAIPCAAGHVSANYHEPHAVECSDGSLVLQIRNHGEPWAKEIIQSESHDGGQTWSTPHPTGVVGEPPHLLRLEDGRLLMSYGYRLPPYGNQCRISADNGQSWSEPFIISNDGGSGDLGYPSTVQLGEDRFLTVWYEKLQDRPFAVLRQAKWALA